MSAFKDARHLFRFAGLFVLAFWCFWWCATICAKSFWAVWALSRGAVGEIANLPVKFAGHQACEDCHTDVVAKKEDRQARARELRGLPGALASHAATSTVKRFCRTRLCSAARCIRPQRAKPKGFPQVEPASTLRDALLRLHKPHSRDGRAGDGCRSAK